MRLRTIIAECRACAFVRDRSPAEPRHRENAPLADERNIDPAGWVHDHPVTPETERLADEVHPRPSAPLPHC